MLVNPSSPLGIKSERSFLRDTSPFLPHQFSSVVEFADYTLFRGLHPCQAEDHVQSVRVLAVSSVDEGEAPGPGSPLRTDPAKWPRGALFSPNNHALGPRFTTFTPLPPSCISTQVKLLVSSLSTNQLSASAVAQSR